MIPPLATWANGKALVAASSTRQLLWKPFEIQTFSSWLKSKVSTGSKSRKQTVVNPVTIIKHCCCLYFRSKIINIMFSPYFWFCKHEAYAERVKGKDPNCLWLDRGSYFYLCLCVKFLHGCLACLPVVRSKQPGPLQCIYLALCLHKAAQLDKDFAIFVLPRLWKPKGPQWAAGFIWPSHAGDTWTVKISESIQLYFLTRTLSFAWLYRSNAKGIQHWGYAFYNTWIYYCNLVCVFITHKGICALGANEIPELLCKFS